MAQANARSATRMQLSEIQPSDNSSQPRSTIHYVDQIIRSQSHSNLSVSQRTLPPYSTEQAAPTGITIFEAEKLMLMEGITYVDLRRISYSIFDFQHSTI